MPELPEIENVCAILRLHLVNEKILDVQINQHKLRATIPDNLNAIAAGQTITAIHRIAKYIVIELTNNHSIISHLGMTGAWLFREQGKKHDHLFMQLTNNIHLTYNDPRKFGLIAVSPSPAANHSKLLAQIGIEPLSAQFSSELLYQLLQQSSSNIKAFLMNQAFIAGIGNIYASEILFMTKIHPLRKTHDITVAEAAAMHQAIQSILHTAIQYGGSYIKNYIMPTENRGDFQHQLQVYDRMNKNCFCCSQPIQRITQNNRSTFYCNNCQR